ncbi:GNAT family N-acetyltransferase [Chitinibacter sp. SCUT-21]|uniref:GNAT family N-acetyltransferase n=1 Tax=Chitinibacter sp. SCUT-21 TaxID=2970891 RepID=UPI0035A6D4AD
MWSLAATVEADFEDLLAIRIAAMRESLERLGRFDPERARQRLRANFNPAATQKILVDNAVVGFYAINETELAYSLDHLYILPSWQGQGIGGAVLTQIKQTYRGKEIALCALRGSDANRFYQVHGFTQCSESEWDIEYVFDGYVPVV